MKITELSIKRPVALLMIVIALLAFGVVSLVDIPSDLIPEMNLPITVVSTVYPMAGPSEVEELVTREIENVAATVDGVTSISSTSYENVSIVALQFEYGSDLIEKNASIKEKTDAIVGKLPEGCQTPVVSKVNINSLPVVTLAMSAPDMVELLNTVEQEIKPMLEQVSGVASVDVAGGVEREIRLTLMPERLNQYSINAQYLSNFLKYANVNIPAGSIEFGEKQLLVRGKYEYHSLEQLKSLPITLPSGNVIKLSDVCTVSLYDKQPNSIAKMNGNECVTLSLNKQQNGNTVNIAKEARNIVDSLQNREDFDIFIVSDQGKFIDDSISNVVSSLLLGALLAVIVLWLFLGDFKISAIIATSIPLSVVLTFTFMSLIGINLNLVSLGSIVIAVGMMVDNAIVVIESMHAVNDEGYSFKDAALRGVKLVGSAIVASTLTSISVFLPMVFSKGLAKEIFGQSSFVISFALIVSLISALTLIPCLFVRLKPQEKSKSLSYRGFHKLQELYGRMLTGALKHKLMVIGAAVLLLLGSVMLIPMVGMELMPSVDQGQISIKAISEPGLSINQMNAIATDMETELKRVGDIERFSTKVAGGSGVFSSGSSNVTTIDVFLNKDKHYTTQQNIELIRQLMENVTGADISVASVNAIATAATGGAMGGNYSLDIKGNDLESLKYVSNLVEQIFLSTPGIKNVSTSISQGMPEVLLNVDPAKAANYGLVSAGVLSAVKNQIEGLETGEMTLNSKKYKMILKYPNDVTIDTIGSVQLLTPAGMVVPYSEVGSVTIGEGPVKIERMDGLRLVSVSGQIEGRDAGSVSSEVNAKIAQLDLPLNVSFEAGQEESMRNEAFSGLSLSLIMAVLLVILIMAAQFESIRFALVVMFSIPLGFTGGILALILSNGTLNLASFIGIIMLVGIVINNAIVLVDKIGQLRKEGMERSEAIILAGTSRLRPIIMTTLTTVLSLIPLAIGLGSGSEVMRPMAVITMGGLLSSTILTLIVLPCLYVVFDKKKRGKKHELLGEEKESVL